VLFAVSSSFRHRRLHAFPTRRSSDLVYFSSEQQPQAGWDGKLHWRHQEWKRQQMSAIPNKAVLPVPGIQGMGWSHCARAGEAVRSEEHTSELQSRFDLVCRLLLEKQK